jgi:sialic acid synthase SpsE
MIFYYHHKPPVLASGFSLILVRDIVIKSPSIIYMKIINKLRKTFSVLPSKVKIGTVYVGPGEKTFVIAEVGINHNGDIEIAKRLIDAARESGADAVKFQKRTTTEILTKEGLDKPYTSVHAYGATYGEHRNKLEFSEKEYIELKRYCDEKGVLFFASVWDEKSADFMDKLNIDAYKIPSADTINIPLLEYVAKKNKPVLLSTGMNSVKEIELAVKTVRKFNSRVVIFHCLSLYPSPEDKINLLYMSILRDKFRPLPVGYSGHEIDLLPTLVAVSMGAVIVERHLTLDKSMKGSDHAASLNPSEFKELIHSIRRIEKILGKPQKIMYDELKPLRDKLAKSVVTKIKIPKGTAITRDMLTIKGPGTGISPLEIDKLIGIIANEDIEADKVVPKEILKRK